MAPAARTRTTVGVLFDSLLGGCEEELWIAISLAARALDANLLCFVGNGVLSEADALYTMAAVPSVDGIIAVSSSLAIPRPAGGLERLLERFRPRPVVSIGKDVPGATSLLIQGGDGVRELVGHLVEAHGRRRVAFIRGPDGSEEAEERLAGYREGLARHGLPYRPELVMPGDFRRPLAVEAVRAWHRQGTAFDALICANDFMAVHAMRELQLLGRRVPEDVALAGFDDIPETIAVTPTLTTARQPLRPVGREAVRTVLALIRGEPVPSPLRFPAEVVVRRSCGCLRGAQAQAVRRGLTASPVGGPTRLALAEALDASFPEVKEIVQQPDWAGLVLEELLRDLRGDRGDRLTRFLEDLLSRFDPRRGIAGQWRDIVEAAFALQPPAECGVALETWLAVREDTLAVVATLAEQRLMRFSVLRAEGYKGIVENYYWNALLDEPELWKALQTGLFELGIESLLVARYTDPRRDRAALVLRFGSTDRVIPDCTEGPFAPAALFAGLRSPERRYDFVVFSLLPSSGQEGFALFETVVERSVPDPSLVHELRRRLSVTTLMGELTRHAGELEDRVAERTRQLQEAQRQLVDAAHQAGMAEIAVGALHNVGNLLNSVTISAESAAELLDRSSLGGLHKANELLHGQEGDLAGFFGNDPRAQLLPGYYARIAASLDEEHGRVRASLGELLERTGLIRETIRSLQEYAHNGLDMLLREEADLAAVLDLALEVHAQPLAHDGVQVHREYDREAPRLVLPRAKIVHVLVNLVKNAVDALAQVRPEDRRLTVQVRRAGERVRVRIQDSGEGIPPENLGRLFNYGFTTKPGGHGFGLHTCANYVRQMGGTITGESDGPGRGATFTVEFQAAGRDPLTPG
jgi:DNA-binding LacI/PurR family transcriptional regulator/signal transduction histidine kinase